MLVSLSLGSRLPIISRQTWRAARQFVAAIVTDPGVAPRSRRIRTLVPQPLRQSELVPYGLAQVAGRDLSVSPVTLRSLPYESWHLRQSTPDREGRSIYDTQRTAPGGLLLRRPQGNVRVITNYFDSHFPFASAMRRAPANRGAPEIYHGLLRLGNYRPCESGQMVTRGV